MSVFTGDSLGIVGENDLDEFFGVTDTENAENSGPVTATWTFDVSSVSATELSVGVGAMGDFESSDFFTWSYAFDGGATAVAIASSVDEAASQDYTLDGGGVFTLSDPMSANGVLLNNNFAAISVPLDGSGSQLAVTLTASTNGGTEAFAFQNLVITEGTPPPPGTTADLLMTEVVVTPTNGEFVEIYNNGTGTVDLSDVYLTDATFAGGSVYYYQIVLAGGGGGSFGDFHARFPDGASIAAGEYQTVSLAGSADFIGEYGSAPTYELFDDGTADSAVAMREATPGSVNGQGGLSNSGEVVVLYAWDGASNLVGDIDYFVWGDKAEAIDKTGVTIGGGFGSTYLADTSIADQDPAADGSHSFGNSWQRDDLAEGTEAQAGGNGAGGSDETSENLSDTWCETAPTPGAASECPEPPAFTPTAIHDVQGNGLVSPIVGAAVEIDGIVVGDFQASDELNGFYVQEADADADADPTTSEGIYVFEGGSDVDCSCRRLCHRDRCGRRVQ